jgi:S1-C subfamily serine protease
VVSATSGAWRTWRGGQIDAFIRPDVNVYYGFSGGALVDINGNFIGVNTTGLTRGAPATLPASTVSRVVDELLSRGHVRRGYLGVGLHPVRLPDGREGLMIVSLEPDGPAAKSGVFLGDVLLTLEGHAVTDTDDVQAHLAGDQVGRQIEAEILRGGSTMTIRVVPGERPTGAR